MPRKKRCAYTYDLFGDALPEPCPQFDKEDIKAGTIEGKLALMISKMLKTDGRSRKEIAEVMSEYLDDAKMSEHMLDAYASQARTTQKITGARLWALIVITGNICLLQEILKETDYLVVERRYWKRIKRAEKEEAIALLKAQLAELEAQDD